MGYPEEPQIFPAKIAVASHLPDAPRDPIAGNGGDHALDVMSPT